MYSRYQTPDGPIFVRASHLSSTPAMTAIVKFFMSKVQRRNLVEFDVFMEHI